MSEREFKGLPTSLEADPKTDVFGAPVTDLKRSVSRFAARLRRQYSDEITGDPRRFKTRVVTLLRQSLPPFPGRPTEQTISRAIDLRNGAQDWQQIYPQCIPDHSELEPAARRQAESNLRAAIRSRRNAAQRRKRQRRLIAESRSGENVPLFKMNDSAETGFDESTHPRTSPIPQG